MSRLREGTWLVLLRAGGCARGSVAKASPGLRLPALCHCCWQDGAEAEGIALSFLGGS